ncbi:MAG: cell envelope integrity protein CreD [Patescibacteria group bacterium]
MDKIQKIFQSTTLRVVLVGILALLLLIPVGMIKSVIFDRENNRDLAIQDITSKWGGEQTIAGPVLTVPYDLYRTVDGRQIKEMAYVHFLPEHLNIETEISPELRTRGIYDAVVYSSNISFSGDFVKPDFVSLGINFQYVHWNEAFVSVGIPDIRGLEDRTTFNLNGKEIDFISGIKTDDVIRDINVYKSDGFDFYPTMEKAMTTFADGGNASGLSVNIPASALYTTNTFSFDLKLKGSERIAFVPLGKTTDVSVNSDWVSPSFDGSFLPDNREISDTGFSGSWHVLDLNRNYPQSWTGNTYEIYNSSFGVSLIEPVDSYQKSERSAKYALLIITLTFLVFLSFEIFNRTKIHPIQYILVGLALVLFYALLVSVSEVFGFNFAYILAGIATIALILLYSLTVLKEKRFVFIEGGVLVFLYLFIFILLQLEDYALLIGSIGLFIILASLMYLSRKIDWYSLDNRDRDVI